MAALTFAQPARRNLFAPIATALVLFGIVLGLVLYLTPHTIADISVSQPAIYAAHTVFKSNSIVVGQDPSQDDLYLIVTVRIQDRLRLPLFIKDFTATLTPSNPDGTPAEPITSSAVQKLDIPNLYTSFPALKALAAQQTAQPLYREIQIDPGNFTEGTVLLHFPVTQTTWNQRKTATLTIDFYHQGQLSVPIPTPKP